MQPIDRKPTAWEPTNTPPRSFIGSSSTGNRQRGDQDPPDLSNGLRADGQGVREAVVAAGQSRFRPIVLTSLTTFIGLTPMLLERSMQAQFLIPMATSPAFGVLFSTLITLIVVPCGYLILEDLGSWVRGERPDHGEVPLGAEPEAMRSAS